MLAGACVSPTIQDSDFARIPAQGLQTSSKPPACPAKGRHAMHATSGTFGRSNSHPRKGLGIEGPSSAQPTCPGLCKSNSPKPTCHQGLWGPATDRRYPSPHRNLAKPLFTAAKAGQHGPLSLQRPTNVESSWKRGCPMEEAEAHFTTLCI